MAILCGRAEKVLAPVTKFLLRHGIDAKSEWKIGHGREHCPVRRPRQVRMIIKGSHGHGTLVNLVMGSVATEVLAHCQVRCCWCVESFDGGACSGIARMKSCARRITEPSPPRPALPCWRHVCTAGFGDTHLERHFIDDLGSMLRTYPGASSARPRQRQRSRPRQGIEHHRVQIPAVPVQVDRQYCRAHIHRRPLRNARVPATLATR